MSKQKIFYILSVFLVIILLPLIISVFGNEKQFSVNNTATAYSTTTTSITYDTNAQVWHSVPDSNGGIYIAGDFTSVSSTTRNRIAHILSDGTIDPNFDPNANGTVFRIALSPDESILYMVGDFTSVSSTTRNAIAAVNTSNGNLVTSFAPSASQGRGIAISPDGNTLYVGGYFSSVSSTTRNRLVALNTSDGSIITGFDPNVTGGSSIQNLTLSSNGGTLYLGGSFTTVGTTTRNRIAAVNTSDGSLVTNFNPDLNNAVFISTLSSDDNTLYIGGTFTTVGTTTRNRIAAINTSDGSLITTFNPNINNIVRDIYLAPNATSLYVGGYFTQVGTTTINYIAKVNLSDGSLDNTFNPDINNIVFDITSSANQDKLYVGGIFTTVNSLSRLRFASFPVIPEEVVTTTRTYRLSIEGAAEKRAREDNLVPEDNSVNIDEVLVTTSTSTSSTTPIVATTTETKPIVTTETFTFTRNLRQGMISEDIRELQKFLNKYGFQVAQTGAGSPGKETTYFGNLTRLAVIKFQEVYVKDILSPLNLEKGTGFFGIYSREAANKILLTE